MAKILAKPDKFQRDMRNILVAMIMDKTTLAAISARWKDKGHGFFASNEARLLANWCVEYFQEYQCAPQRHLEETFSDWSENVSDAEAESVRILIASLDKHIQRQYESVEEFNSKRYIKLANEFCSSVRLQQVYDQVGEAIDRNDQELLLELASKFKPYNIGQSSVRHVDFSNKMIEEALDEEHDESLIKFDGDVGEFFGEDLGRSCFVAVLAQQKKGKSFILQEFAYRALIQGRRVAYFIVGDLSEKQVLRRIIRRALKVPRKATSTRWPVRFDTEYAEQSDGYLLSKQLDLPHPSKEKIIDRAKKFRSKYMRVNQDRLKLVCSSAGTTKVESIWAEIQGWADDGWFADVIVIDYADVLQRPRGMSERDGHNEIWQVMNRMSKDLDCLVITATQANRPSEKTTLLSKIHVSEDIRKTNHVTGMFGLNQSDDERRHGIYRFNWIVRREAEYDSSMPVSVASCLAVARPIVCSAYLPGSQT